MKQKNCFFFFRNDPSTRVFLPEGYALELKLIFELTMVNGYFTLIVSV